eukprot:jgi/Astpho2/6620/fgenesh1_pg.00101_%23_26_t
MLACLSYGGVSVSITMFNKAVFSLYGFNYPNFVTTLQILVSILYMAILGCLGWFKFSRFKLRAARQMMPLVLFWWLYVVSGVTALRYLTVPMFSVFRRSTTLIVVAGEYLLFKKRPTMGAMLAICIMLTGAVIAGATDLTYNLPGYIWVSICAVSTAVYLLLIRLLKEKTGLNDTSMLLYNNLLSLPVMLSYMVMATDELLEVHRFPLLWDMKFQLFLLVSASQAFLLNLCIFRCTTINSPLATTITGQMKDILTTGLGMFVFGDVIFDIKNFLGVCTGLSGGIAYAMLGYFDRQKQQHRLAETKR